MRYVLKQKLFSFTDSFRIQNSDGVDVYEVQGRIFSLGKQLIFRSLAGEELATISQKLIAMRPTYEIERNGKTVATVKRALFSFMRHRFSVDVPGPDDLEAQGDFLDHEYEFTRHGQTVARVSKRWFTFTDTYGVEVNEGEDDVLILATAVVIDLVTEEKEEE